MKKMTPKQLQIFRFIGNGEVKKKDIVAEFGDWHYANSSFHIGNILSRMVNSGFLHRVKQGVYAKGSRVGQAVSPQFAKNQLKLFK